jgi:S1-C subfamily serine protease
LKAVFEQWAPAVVRIEKIGGLGSGIILSAEGLVLTNRHVVLNAYNVLVAFYGHKDDQGELLRFPAHVIAVDKVRDMALVKVKDPPENLKVLGIDAAVQVDAGDELFAIGHPLGEDWTPTSGVASTIREDYEWDHGFTRSKADVIQFQTPISPGNSGGPLLDIDGKLVGINTFGKPMGQNINFAVCATEIKDFIDNRDKYSSDDVQDWRPVSLALGTELERSGIRKAQQCDFENDGVVDLVRLDSDNNGDWDRMLMDVDRDSRFEFTALDGDADGYYEVLLLETSGDGTPDYMFRDNPPIRIPVAVRYLQHNR